MCISSFTINVTMDKIRLNSGENLAICPHIDIAGHITDNDDEFEYVQLLVISCNKCEELFKFNLLIG